MDEFFEELKPGCFMITRRGEESVAYPIKYYGTNFIFPELWALMPLVYGVYAKPKYARALNFHMKGALDYVYNGHRGILKRIEIVPPKYLKESFE